MRGYGSPWARLTATVNDGDGECWLGGGRACRFGYVRLLFWVPGLQKRVRLTSHIATWVCIQLAPEAPWRVKIDELYLGYQEFRASGLELDHTCHEPRCRNPAHLDPKTHRENCQERSDYYRALADARPVEVLLADDEEVPF